MLCYVLGFLLINTYSGSLGLARGLPQHTTIATSLTELASHCGNPFLSNQIKSKLSDCSVVVSSHNEKQLALECLMFYDINKQLCDAVATTKLALTEDSIAKIKEPDDVQKLCSLAKKWNIPNIVEYPYYKSTVDKVLEKSVTCAKLCGVDDIMSQDTNFFCKYYKWGSEMLSHSSNAPAQEENNALPAVSGPETKTIETKVENKPNSVVTNPANVPVILSNSAPEPAERINGAPSDTTLPKGEQQVNTGLSKARTKSQGNNGNALDKVSTINNKDVGSVVLPDNVGASNIAIDNSNALLDNVEVALDNVEVALDNRAADIDNHNANPLSDLKPPLILEDAANIKGQLDDSLAGLKGQEHDRVPPQDDEDLEGVFPEDNEKRKDLSEGDEDGGDPHVEEPETKLNPEKKKNSAKGDGEKDSFANTMQEGFNNDGDDHFFPVFLTAVVLVVLLYVLYHNKNKVSKMFLGLVVEGRQTGRRRNSRGHAYRRLDTLEQAMSDKSAAPPSKIIY